MVLIGMAVAVYLIAENVSIEAGAVAFLIVIGILIVLMAHVERKDMRAYGNFVDYWADRRYRD